MTQQDDRVEMEEIGAYQARIHLGQLLDRVGEGAGYVISKRQRSLAVLVPYELWQNSQAGADSADARELDTLVRELQQRHAETTAALDEAFEELAATRRLLAEIRTEREAERGGHDGKGAAHARTA